MKLHNLTSTDKSRHQRTRKGRGIAAGKGKTAGRGMNGQNSRSGGGVRIGFEGGQNPWYRRLPKRGFKNFNKKHYQIVNLEELNKAFKSGDLVDAKSLKAKGLIAKEEKLIKILGNGKLDKKLSFKVDKVSESALEQIKKNHGNIVV